MRRSPLMVLTWGNSVSTSLARCEPALELERPEKEERLGFMEILWHSTESRIEHLYGPHVLSVVVKSPCIKFEG